eukprot:2490041-Alexandrium_andersonii.AAC.1
MSVPGTPRSASPASSSESSEGVAAAQPVPAVDEDDELAHAVVPVAAAQPEPRQRALLAGPSQRS